jgi:hypothetical protein
MIPVPRRAGVTRVFTGEAADAKLLVSHLSRHALVREIRGDASVLSLLRFISRPPEGQVTARNGARLANPMEYWSLRLPICLFV